MLEYSEENKWSMNSISKDLNNLSDSFASVFGIGIKKLMHLLKLDI